MLNDFWPHETKASELVFLKLNNHRILYNGVFLERERSRIFIPTGIHPIKYKLCAFTFYSYLWNKTHNAVQRGPIRPQAPKPMWSTLQGDAFLYPFSC